MSPLRQKLVKVLGFGAVVIVVFYGLFKATAHYNRMSYLPADIKAAGILYSKEENWGSILLALPGDNETGVVMYSLSDAQADEINSEGLKFFIFPKMSNSASAISNSHFRNGTKLRSQTMTTAGHSRQSGKSQTISASTASELILIRPSWRWWMTQSRNLEVSIHTGGSG
jgi:hypothetical protein